MQQGRIETEIMSGPQKDDAADLRQIGSGGQAAHFSRRGSLEKMALAGKTILNRDLDMFGKNLFVGSAIIDESTGAS